MSSPSIRLKLLYLTATSDRFFVFKSIIVLYTYFLEKLYHKTYFMDNYKRFIAKDCNSVEEIYRNLFNQSKYFSS